MCCRRFPRPGGGRSSALLDAEADEQDVVDPRALAVAARSVLDARRTPSDPPRHRRRAVGRRLVGRRARVRAAKARRESLILLLARRLAEGAPVAGRAGADAETSDDSSWAAQRWRSAPAVEQPVRQTVRASDAAPHSRAVGRQSLSSRSSWRACWIRTSTRSSRSLYPTRSRGSCVGGSPGFRRRHARRWPSPRQSATLGIPPAARGGWRGGTRPGRRRARRRAR